MYLKPEQIHDIRETVWEYYRANGRSMPWRDDPSPFNVLVSELMLQQTQVNRVIPKFDAFLYTCINFEQLAALPLSRVLELWSGLGYNRRAKFLHQTAQIVTRDFGGMLPDSLDELVKLPGIGPNTAGAILAYAFNQPSVFVETNIRTVVFHHVFHDRAEVTDAEVREVVEQLCDTEHPREWYWALMDYGTYLKQTHGGKLDVSRHYKKQSPLAGSPREMRGRIIKSLVIEPMGDDDLRVAVSADERFEPAVNALIAEGMVEFNHGMFRLTGHDKRP